MTKRGNSRGEEEIQDHIFTLLVAGVDPTALVISWALYAIHEEPDILARLQSEGWPASGLVRLPRP